ncbi:fungal-specific transcription factor domain-containing protein [Macrophomina phaseolina]|uniref:Fungal-specific transcription factor domain-containing protein n=1 Tax=Macrophomina phaseolina TaxID=35725 RepID=A0ABQ8FRN1_9PEZI|nr:fungal-specific transcription factor domain-containing protein [Macrophomina phaseolina]
MPGRACDVCRRRKQRCVFPEGGALCLTCQALGVRECTFLEPPPPKRRPPQSRTAQQLQAGSGVDSSSSSSNQPAAAAAAAAARRASSTDSAQSPAGRPDLPPSTSFDYPRGSLLAETLGLEKSRFAAYVGPQGEHDWLLLRHDLDQQHHDPPAAPHHVHPRVQLRRVQDGVLFRMTPDSASAPPRDRDQVSVDDVEALVRPHGPTLVKLYFRIVHPSFPILHKEVFVEKYNRTYREITPPLLASVYCLAAKWWMYDEKLILQEKIDEVALADVAYRAVQEAFRRPRLNTIQAGLLLLQRHQNPLALNNALLSTFTASLIALGQHFGLHLDCSDWAIPVWERGLRKRLAWALIMQDTFSALTLGTHPLIQLSDWATKMLEPADFSEGPQDEDSGEQPSIEDGKAMFIETAQLAIICTRIYRDLYSARAMRELVSLSQILEVSKPLGHQLADLLKSLPPELRLGYFQTGRLCSSGCFHLIHHAATVAVHRRLLWAAQEAPVTTDPQFLQFLRSTQLQRARTIATFLSQLQPEHMESFWSFAAGSCVTMLGCFLGLLNVTCVSRQESDELRALMRDFEWQLRMKAKMGEWVTYALTRLRALGWDRWRSTEPDAPSEIAMPTTWTSSVNLPTSQEIPTDIWMPMDFEPLNNNSNFFSPA